MRWRKDGIDLVKLIVQESQRRKIEVFWEHRLNGADREVDVNTPAVPPLKKQHPEWLLSLLQSGWLHGVRSRAEIEAELETARRTLRGELVPVRRSSTEVVRAADFRGRRRA